MAIWSRRSDPNQLAIAAAGVALRAQGLSPDDILYAEILERKSQTESAAKRFGDLCQRADALYYPTDITDGGSDHWAAHKSARTKGKVHVSVNDPPVFVDVPADIQAIPPDVDVPPDSHEPTDLEAADRREKLFWTWWMANQMDMQLAITSHVRSLYGATALQPYWGGDIPRFRVMETPSDLRIGWGASDFSRMDWAMRLFSLSPWAVREEYQLDVQLSRVGNQNKVVIVAPAGTDLYTSQDQTAVAADYEKLQVTVYDYWYKKIEGDTVQVWNALYVGNHQVRNQHFLEFDDIPFIYIANGKLPGRPYGRGELYDIEQIIRERDEQITRNGQAFADAGAMYQINGPNAPTERVSAAQRPQPGGVATPGPGNVINPINPWTPEYQFDQYLNRLDTYAVRITGVNDTLLNMRSDASGSSKALRTEISMYVPRIALKRNMLYDGYIHRHWVVAAKMWERKDPKVKAILDGHYEVTVTAPEIVPPDDFEQMQWAATGKQNSLISSRTGMKRIGVKNPTEEFAMIMQEKTNGAFDPASVAMILSLLQQAQALNVSPQVPAQLGGQTIRDSAIADLMARRTAATQRANTPPPGGTNSANQPAAGSPETLPANAVEGGVPLTQQTMIAKGQFSSRLLGESQVGQ